LRNGIYVIKIWDVDGAFITRKVVKEWFVYFNNEVDKQTIFKSINAF
jgi:hypothetical protein